MKSMIVAMALLSSLSVMARQISEGEARRIAEQQLGLTATANRAPMKGKAVSHTVDASAASMYIFNGENGFAVIAGDDAMPNMVLAYGFDSHFDADNCSPALKAWIADMSAYIAAGQFATTAVDPTLDYSNPVAPMITTRWNQGYPYNLLTPTTSGGSHMPTGCVATAMAQVMNFWKYPTAGGLALHTYEWNGQTLEVDFTQSIYDWANMTDTYGSSSTDIQRNAVAKLMYDCGVASDMQYGATASGTSDQKCAWALSEIFGYGNNMRLRASENIDRAEWNRLVKKELDAGRPVLYCGTTPSLEGHAFVCDGYDADGMHHINWGWGGTANGYFDLLTLNPYSQGIGGAASGQGFSLYQSIITGLQPPTEGESGRALGWELMTYDFKVVTLDEAATKFKVTFGGIVNGGFKPFAGEIGIYFGPKGAPNEYISIRDFTEDPLRAGYGILDFTLIGFDTSEYSDGLYELVVVGIVDDIKYVASRDYRCAPLEIEIKDGKMVTSTDLLLRIFDVAYMPLDYCTHLDGNRASYHRFDFAVANSSQIPFVNNLELDFMAEGEASPYYSTVIEPGGLGVGESKDFSMAVPLRTDGSTAVQIVESILPAGITQSPIFEGGAFTIADPGAYYELKLGAVSPSVDLTTGLPVITLTAAASYGDTSSNPDFSASLTKTVTCSLYRAESAYAASEEEPTPAAVITADYSGSWGENKQLLFTPATMLPDGNYLARFTYPESGSNPATIELGAEREYPGLDFSLGVSSLSGIGQDKPQTPVLYYNLQGIRVSNEMLQPGMYLQRQGSRTTKVTVK